MKSAAATCWFLFAFAPACGPTAPGAGDDDDDVTHAEDAGSPPCPDCVNACPAGTQTALGGIVTAPNGVDPIPGAVVYLPRGLDEFPDTVACELCDQIAPDAIMTASTGADGRFALHGIPTRADAMPGQSVMLVTQMGRFRRVSEVPIANWCDTNEVPEELTRLPARNEGWDRIPRIAVASGDYDAMECVLAKIGIHPDEIDLWSGQGSGGTVGTVGRVDELLGDPARLAGYNVVFLNCTSNNYEAELADPAVRANLRAYVEAGGRLYVTDWSYDFVEQIESWAPIIDFAPSASGGAPEPLNAAAIGNGGITTEALVRDADMRQWIEAVEARSGDDVMSPDGRVHVEHFLAGWVMQLAVPAADAVRVWLTGVVSGMDWGTGVAIEGELPLTTTFDVDQCGRVLYSSYHTRGRDLGGTVFPTYCALDEPLAPQERVLEYLILHITSCIEID